MRERLEEIRAIALTLELAIRGAMKTELLDCGDFGQSLADMAGVIADKAKAPVEQTR
jgi:hypothetical protein